MRKVTDDELSTLLSVPRLLVDFYADWCGPCKVMAPVLAALEPECPDTVFVKLDVDVQSAHASRFLVRSIPTLIHFRNGVEVKRFVGVVSREALRNVLTAS